MVVVVVHRAGSDVDAGVAAAQAATNLETLVLDSHPNYQTHADFSDRQLFVL